MKMSKKIYNSSIFIARILIDVWNETCGDEKVKEEKAKHYYDAFVRYLTPLSGRDIDYTWKRILVFLKKELYADVEQMILDLMVCEVPSLVIEAVEKNGSFNRQDNGDAIELLIKDLYEMTKYAFGFAGKLWYIVDHAVKIDENILKIEASIWSMSIGDGDECAATKTTFAPNNNTHWIKMQKRTYLYLIKEKRLIEI